MTASYCWVVRLFPGVGVVDGVIGRFQGFDQAVGKNGVVFNDKQTHGRAG
jgi:hypothetical protein